MESSEKSNQVDSKSSRPRKRDPKVSDYSGRPITELLEEIKKATKVKKIDLIIQGINETLSEVSGAASNQLSRLAFRTPKNLPSVRELLEELTIFCDTFISEPQSALNRLARLEMNVIQDLSGVYEEIREAGYKEGYQACLQAQRNTSTIDLDRLCLDED